MPRKLIIKQHHQGGRQPKVTDIFSPVCRSRSLSLVSLEPGPSGFTASGILKPGACGDFEGFTFNSEAMNQEQQVFLILWLIHCTYCLERLFDSISIIYSTVHTFVLPGLSLSGPVPAPLSPEKRESSVLARTSKHNKKSVVMSK